MIGDSAIGAVQEECFGRVARTLIGGFTICEEDGVPLNELQKIALLQHAFLCMDGLAEDARMMLDTTRAVDELRDRTILFSLNGNGGRAA